MTTTNATANAAAAPSENIELEPIPRSTTQGDDLSWLRPINDQNSFWKFFVMDTFNAERLVTSPWFDAKWLLIYRLFLALLYWATLIIEFVAYYHTFEYATWVFYMTHMSFLGLIMYFTTASIITWQYIQDPVAFLKRTNATYALRFFSWSVLYATCATLTLIVPLVYWWLLSDSFFTNPAIFKFTGAVMHASDFVFFYVEVLLNSMILVWQQVFFVLTVIVVYACWMWLAHGILRVDDNGFLSPNGQPFWAYPIFDWDIPSNAVYYVGVVVIAVLFHFLTLGLHILKDKIKTRPDGGSRLARIQGDHENIIMSLKSQPEPIKEESKPVEASLPNQVA